jgi:hypothetical protein
MPAWHAGRSVLSESRREMREDDYQEGDYQTDGVIGHARSRWQSVCPARRSNCRSNRANCFDDLYLRAAQAYMLISMPTGSSTILGVFQAIPSSQ